MKAKTVTRKQIKKADPWIRLARKVNELSDDIYRVNEEVEAVHVEQRRLTTKLAENETVVQKKLAEMVASAWQKPQEPECEHETLNRIPYQDGLDAWHCEHCGVKFSIKQYEKQ